MILGVPGWMTNMLHGKAEVRCLCRQHQHGMSRTCDPSRRWPAFQFRLESGLACSCHHWLHPTLLALSDWKLWQWVQHQQRQPRYWPMRQPISLVRCKRIGVPGPEHGATRANRLMSLSLKGKEQYRLLRPLSQGIRGASRTPAPFAWNGLGMVTTAVACSADMSSIASVLVNTSSIQR